MNTTKSHFLNKIKNEQIIIYILYIKNRFFGLIFSSSNYTIQEILLKQCYFIGVI